MEGQEVECGHLNQNHFPFSVSRPKVTFISGSHCLKEVRWPDPSDPQQHSKYIL